MLDPGLFLKKFKKAFIISATLMFLMNIINSHVIIQPLFFKYFTRNRNSNPQSSKSSLLTWALSSLKGFACLRSIILPYLYSGGL